MCSVTPPSLKPQPCCTSLWSMTPSRTTRPLVSHGHLSSRLASAQVSPGPLPRLASLHRGATDTGGEGSWEGEPVFF